MTIEKVKMVDREVQSPNDEKVDKGTQSTVVENDKNIQTKVYTKDKQIQTLNESPILSNHKDVKKSITEPLDLQGKKKWQKEVEILNSDSSQSISSVEFDEIDQLKLQVQNLEWENQQHKYWIQKYKDERKDLQNQIGPCYLEDDDVKNSMNKKFGHILKQINLLSIPTLRYIISSKHVFDNLDILGQNFMQAFFFRDFELQEANEKLKSMNQTKSTFFIKDMILDLGFMPRQIMCAEDYHQIDEDLYRSLYDIRNYQIAEIIIELIYFKGIKERVDRMNFLPKLMDKVIIFPVQQNYTNLHLTNAENYLIRCQEIISCIEQMTQQKFYELCLPDKYSYTNRITLGYDLRHQIEHEMERQAKAFIYEQKKQVHIVPIVEM